MGVGADLQVSAGLPLVHVGVHIAHDRVLDVRLRAAEAGDRPDVDHLVHRGRERDPRAGHAGQARAPDTACDRDHVGLHVAVRRAHPLDAPVLHVDAHDLGLGRHVQRARGDSLLAHQRARAQRVDDADALGVEAPEDHLLVEVRHELLDVGGRQHRHAVDAPRCAAGDPPRELLHALSRARDLDAARADEHTELQVLADALHGERRHLLRVVDEIDEVRRVPGRAAGIRQRPLVEQQDIPPAQAREVVGEAVADDAAADDDGAGVRRQPVAGDHPGR